LKKDEQRSLVISNRRQILLPPASKRVTFQILVLSIDQKKEHKGWQTMPRQSIKKNGRGDRKPLPKGRTLIKHLWWAWDASYSSVTSTIEIHDFPLARLWVRWMMNYLIPQSSDAKTDCSGLEMFLARVPRWNRGRHVSKQRNPTIHATAMTVCSYSLIKTPIQAHTSVQPLFLHFLSLHEFPFDGRAAERTSLPSKFWVLPLTEDDSWSNHPCCSLILTCLKSSVAKRIFSFLSMLCMAPHDQCSLLAQPQHTLQRSSLINSSW